MNTKYSGMAMSFHWVTFFVIVAAFGVGTYMVDLGFSPTKLKLFNWHKWIGVTVFIVAVLRVLWRLTHKPPPPLPGQPAWQLFAASAVHVLLYFLILAIPISGWLYSSASGFTTVYLGQFPIPDLIGKNPEIKDTIKLAHYIQTRVLALIVFVHVAATVKHFLTPGDRTLSRMLPGKSK